VAFKILKSICVLLLASQALGAQALTGRISDGTNARPVAGAVVMLRDSSGYAITRTITNDSGHYRLRLAGRYVGVEVRRIGYRPTSRPVPALNEDARLDIELRPVATMLEAVRVADRSVCPARRDRAQALALWEQAKSALLATVVSADVNPGAMRVLTYQRWLDARGVRIQEQHVQIADQTAAASFAAAAGAQDFVEKGFITTKAGRPQYHAPDAHVLLDERFTQGYCFALTRSGSRPPEFLGLSFAPARRVRDVTGIEGTLWVDTLRRRLVDIEYRYATSDRSDRPKSGGFVSFHELRNGTSLIDRWGIRMVHAEQLRIVAPPASARAADRIIDAPNAPVSHMTEGGGELASVRWPDGHTWRAPLGALRSRVTDRGGRPMSHTKVRLKGTDYSATTDSSGVVDIRELLPGPYDVEIIDSALATIDIPIATAIRFEAERDVTFTEPLAASSAVDQVTKMCKDDGAWTTGSVLLIARVFGADNQPVSGASWELGDDRGAVGSDGVFVYCKGLETGQRLKLLVHSGADAPQEHTVTISRQLNVERVQLPK